MGDMRTKEKERIARLAGTIGLNCWEQAAGLCRYIGRVASREEMEVLERRPFYEGVSYI